MTETKQAKPNDDALSAAVWQLIAKEGPNAGTEPMERAEYARELEDLN